MTEQMIFPTATAISGVITPGLPVLPAGVTLNEDVRIEDGRLYDVLLCRVVMLSRLVSGQWSSQ